MATLHDAPRKKMATYGKAARRRIPPVNPEYNTVFFVGPSKSQTPEIQITNEFTVSKHMSPTAEHKNTKPTNKISDPAPPIARIDIFDPPGEDEAPALKPEKKPTKPLPREKEVSSIGATLSTVPIIKTNVFDVPSSDDEVKVVPKVKKGPVKSTTARSIISEKPRSSTQTVDTTEQRKRLKMSPKELNEEPVKKPASAPAQTALQASKKPAKSTKMTSTLSGKVTSTIAKPSGLISLELSEKTIVPAKTAKMISNSSTGITPLIATRPKAPARKITERPKTPRKQSLQPPQVEKCAESIRKTLSPQLSDVDMMDVDPQGQYISPQGLKLWKDLLEPEDEEVKIISSKITGRGPSPRKISPPVFGKKLYKPAGILKTVQKAPRSFPKKRLIDLLAEQASSDASEDESDESVVIDEVQLDSNGSGGFTSKGQSLVSEAVPSMQPASQSQISQIAGPKYVYGRERTILAEKDFMQALEAEMPMPSQVSAGRRTRRGSIPTLPVLASFHDMDLDEEDGAGVAILSVHELRQAGANNRFNDELDDFIERIGSPSGSQASLRRSGLLDLTNKLQDKNFARQFRANGAEDKLFVHLGQENDIIAGFIIVSILMTIFAEGNVQHIIPQLRRQGITRLLIRLLEIETSITTVGKERKSNMSKIAQSLLAEYHDRLAQLAIWEELKPQVISPRTIALKCLEKMVRQTRESGNPDDIFSKELTGRLFDILKAASDPTTWDLPKGKQAIDFSLALSALESHSIMARTAHNEAIWISDFLPVIADTLQIALSQKVEDFGATQLLILRLALNVTNNNSRGADVFARPALLAMMGSVVVAKFKKIARFVREEELCIVMDHLVLTLGVMINFAEWSTPAREALQSLEGRSDDPFDRMAQLFADNQERMSEANSVEESQKNVAFGYLSVLLGYLSLLPALSERIRKRNPRKSLKPLVSSIEEFIGHHKTVDDLIAADLDGHSSHSGLTERLESLVIKLGAIV